MTNKINNDEFENEKIQHNKQPGIHPDMIISAFKVKDIREGMTICGKKITGILKFSKMKEFVLIKKNAFYENVPSNDVILSPHHKIKINGIEKKVEMFLNADNVININLPETTTYHLLTNKKDYICIQNILVECGNENKYENVNDLFLTAI